MSLHPPKPHGAAPTPPPASGMVTCRYISGTGLCPLGRRKIAPPAPGLPPFAQDVGARSGTMPPADAGVVALTWPVLAGQLMSDHGSARSFLGRSQDSMCSRVFSSSSSSLHSRPSTACGGFQHGGAGGVLCRRNLHASGGPLIFGIKMKPHGRDQATLFESVSNMPVHPSSKNTAKNPATLPCVTRKLAHSRPRYRPSATKIASTRCRTVQHPGTWFASITLVVRWRRSRNAGRG